MSSKNKKFKEEAKKTASEAINLPYGGKEYEYMIAEGFKDNPQLIKFLIKSFSKLIKDESDNYEDNFRVCELGNQLQEERYTQARNKGCCGFADAVVTFKGASYRIGFNHGH